GPCLFGEGRPGGDNVAADAAEGVIAPRMSVKPRILVVAWLPEGVLPRLRAEFTAFEFLDAHEPAALSHSLPEAAISYGLPPVDRLAEAPGLRWIQLTSAGVPRDLCLAAQQRGITVSNLAGLYGPSIAEHALTMMGMLARNLHLALRHQQQ